MTSARSAASMKRAAGLLATSIFTMVLVIACGSSTAPATDRDAASDAFDGTYQCTVLQIRNGGCACGEAQPPGSLSGVGFGATFAMTVTGETVDIPGSFSCSGSWSGSNFSCLITGCGYSGCLACGHSCPNVTFVIMPSDPDPARKLAPGQIYVGIPLDNSFNAHCSR